MFTLKRLGSFLIRSLVNTDLVQISSEGRNRAQVMVDDAIRHRSCSHSMSADRNALLDNDKPAKMVKQSKPGRSLINAKLWAYRLPLLRWISITRFGPRPLVWSAIAIIFGTVLFFFTSFPEEFYASPAARNSLGGYGDKALPGIFPAEIGNITGLSVEFGICSVCDCKKSIPSTYNPSGKAANSLPPRPRYRDVYPASDRVELNEFLRLTLLDMYCSGQHLTAMQSTKILHRATSALDEVASWSFSGLQLGKPTIYITTVSSPNSKAGAFRPQYFKRHGQAMHRWLEQHGNNSSEDLGFQLLWVVAEDEISIDPLLALTLRQLGIPYIYFSYGLTKAWGNAQKNAVLQMVNALSRPTASNPSKSGILGHGPVYGLDDDNKMQSDLLTVLTRVVRCGVFPVGNLGGPGGWESPTVDDEGVVTGANGPWPRTFPFDYGGYTFNSSLLGPVITGPKFWKCEEYAGESEFLAQIVGHVKDLEPICGPTTDDQDDCHFIWHNEPLTDEEKGESP
jgi:hypothetical protein